MYRDNKTMEYSALQSIATSHPYLQVSESSHRKEKAERL